MLLKQMNLQQEDGMHWSTLKPFEEEFSQRYSARERERTKAGGALSFLRTPECSCFQNHEQMERSTCCPIHCFSSITSLPTTSLTHASIYQSIRPLSLLLVLTNGGTNSEAREERSYCKTTKRKATRGFCVDNIHTRVPTEEKRSATWWWWMDYCCCNSPTHTLLQRPILSP